jgi:fatty-acyl-CoA synthase
VSAPAARTLSGVLDEIAETAPGLPAVVHHTNQISYRELRDEARRAARGLLALGIQRGDRVGVLLGNQPEWLVTCFAASYLGATLVPLNTWYKRDEIEWMLRHARVTVLIAAASYLKLNYAALLAELAPGLPSLRAIVFVGTPAAGSLSLQELLDGGRTVSEEQLEAAASAVSPEDHAFVLYTSGSTAEPKGVLLRHRGLIENGYQIGARRGVVPDDRVWLGSPLFYGLGAANALPVALTHGAALVIHDYFEAALAIEVIAATAATVWYGTGNMARAILDHPSFSRAKVATLEKGNAGTVAEYKRLTLVDLGITGATPAYGLTESYGQCTGGMPGDPLEVKLHTNGTALPGFEILIVDPTTRESLSVGETGLVLVRGHTTEGYLDNPVETRNAVRPDGSFDTGDLGRLDAAGRFVFHSRLKEVIKSGGISISPVEVEELLAAHPQVTDAHVVGVPHPVRGELVVAFVVARGPLSEDALRAFVKERAASFKVPHHVIFTNEDQLPRVASGKVAKYRLQETALEELSGHKGPGSDWRKR